MTLFSLHHHSNFLRLVPPALWRDPGHCAGSRRGETERITHPGKSELLCGVSSSHAHAPQTPPEPLSSLDLKRSILNVADGLSRPFLGLVCSVFWHKSISPFTRGPLRPPYSSPHNGWRRTGLGQVSSNSTLLSSCLCLGIIDELPIKAAHFGLPFFSSRAGRVQMRWKGNHSLITVFDTDLFSVLPGSHRG